MSAANAQRKAVVAAVAPHLLSAVRAFVAWVISLMATALTALAPYAELVHGEFVMPLRETLASLV